MFDAGRRKAAVDSARASYEAQLADYRSSVLTAIKEVETALVDLDGAAHRSDDARRSVEQYRRYERATEANWRGGFDTLLTLEQARRSLTSAEISYIELQRDRVRSWIALYKALGGGWQTGGASTSTAAAEAAAIAPDVQALLQGTTP